MMSYPPSTSRVSANGPSVTVRSPAGPTWTVVQVVRSCNGWPETQIPASFISRS